MASVILMDYHLFEQDNGMCECRGKKLCALMPPSSYLYVEHALAFQAVLAKRRELGGRAHGGGARGGGARGGVRKPCISISYTTQ